MNPYLNAARVRDLELLHKLRFAIPNGAAEYVGRLDPDQPMSIVEAYLYVRQARLRVPWRLYRSLQRRALEVLGVDVDQHWAQLGRSG